MTQHQHIKRLITVEEYHKMVEVGIISHKDRLELINGEILHMSPIGTKHQSVVNRITNLFLPLFVNMAIVQVQGPLQLNDLSEPEPDILLLRHSKDFYANQHPQPKDAFLLIEVADSSLGFDKESKLAIYSKSNIQEYWVVNLQANQIEIYREPNDDIFRNITILRNEDTVSCMSFPDIFIKAKDILGA